MTPLRVALCGNPNVGKSTVFNALTGMRQHTGNWAGKTVESARGQVKDGPVTWTLVDLPGAYSLFNGSPEEMVASDYLSLAAPDAAVVVCDATCLERGLNLALQVSELCPRTVVCVNLMDEARRRGIQLDLPKLEALLGVAVVGVTAKSRQGLSELKRRVSLAIAQGDKEPERPPLLCYPEPVERAAQALAPVLRSCVPGIPSERSARFWALRLLSCGGSERDSLLQRLSAEGGQALAPCVGDAFAALARDGYDAGNVAAALIGQRYRTAGELCRETVRRQESENGPEQRQLRLDRLLCGKRMGIPVMLCLLALVFYLTLSGANIPSAWLSEKLTGLEPVFAGALRAIGAPGWLADALVLGVYRVAAWVVSVMLPPMAIFFPLFTLLEDLGFLPRVAFNLDKCFQRCRACGKQALCMGMVLGMRNLLTSERSFTILWVNDRYPLR